MADVDPLSKDQFGLPSLVPKLLHLGTPPVPREIPFRADFTSPYKRLTGTFVESRASYDILP